MFWVVLVAVNVDVGMSGQANENNNPFFCSATVVFN